MLIHLAEDIRGQDGEFVRAVRIVEPLDDLLENAVVDLQPWGEIIGRLDPVLLFLKMEEARVVAFVSLAKELSHPVVGVLAIEQGLEPAVDFDPPVLTNS